MQPKIDDATLARREYQKKWRAKRAALFVEGIAEPVTPAAAHAAWTAGESESAAAARQRMIDRHKRAHSATAAEGRENMIRRGGGKGSGTA